MSRFTVLSYDGENDEFITRVTPDNEAEYETCIDALLLANLVCFSDEPSAFVGKTFGLAF